MWCQNGIRKEVNNSMRTDRAIAKILNGEINHYRIKRFFKKTKKISLPKDYYVYNRLNVQAFVNMKNRYRNGEISLLHFRDWMCAILHILSFDIYICDANKSQLRPCYFLVSEIRDIIFGMSFFEEQNWALYFCRDLLELKRTLSILKHLGRYDISYFTTEYHDETHCHFLFIDNFKKTYYVISPDDDIESETMISAIYMTESEYENKISLLNKCGYKSLN